jgi:plastocyanin
VRKETRERLVLPILVPVGALVVILGVLWGFSRILLSVTADAATGTALAVALAIVVFAGIAASRPQVRFSAVAAMAGAVAGVAMLAGGIALVAFAPESEGAGPRGPAVTVSLVAKGLQFDPTKLSVPAGAPFAIAFDNLDATIQHDVQIFDNPDRTGTPLFDGALVTGVGKTTYKVGALKAGTYYFHCVVHPTMTGTIVAAGGGGPGPSEGVAVVAKGLQFDTSEIDLPADTPSSITFTNDDAGIQHNIAIYEDDSLAKVLFTGELVTGVATATYDVPGLPGGTYFFHCDVHPTMSGSVVVKAAPGGGGAGGGSPGPNPSGAPGTSPPPAGGPPPSSVSITASGLQFDKSSFSLPAAGGTISFTNNDAGTQHNIAIYTDASAADNLFRGDLVTGVATVTYTVPSIAPGTYYFHCDVHPTMNGSVTIG